MNIKKSLPHKNYTKVHNFLWTEDLSDGAKVLYGYLASLPNGKKVSDEYISKVLKVTMRTVINRRNELKNLGLVMVNPIAPKVYELYLGYPNFPASKVMEYWDMEPAQAKKSLPEDLLGEVL